MAHRKLRAGDPDELVAFRCGRAGDGQEFGNLVSNDVADVDFVRYRRLGCPDALADFVERTLPDLRRIAYAALRDRASADDAIQATYVIAMTQAHLFKEERRVRPWLVGILRNRLRENRRQRRREEPLPVTEPVNHEQASEVAIRREQRDSVVKTVGEMAEPYKAVRDLYLNHAMEASDIAVFLGRRPATVRTQLCRGLARLRVALASQRRFWICAASLGVLIVSGMLANSQDATNAVDYRLAWAHAVALGPANELVPNWSAYCVVAELYQPDPDMWKGVERLCRAALEDRGVEGARMARRLVQLLELQTPPSEVKLFLPLLRMHGRRR